MRCDCTCLRLKKNIYDDLTSVCKMYDLNLTVCLARGLSYTNEQTMKNYDQQKSASLLESIDLSRIEKKMPIILSSLFTFSFSSSPLLANGKRRLRNKPAKKSFNNRFFSMWLQSLYSIWTLINLTGVHTNHSAQTNAKVGASKHSTLKMVVA